MRKHQIRIRGRRATWIGRPPPIKKSRLHRQIDREVESLTEPAWWLVLSPFLAILIVMVVHEWLNQRGWPFY